MKYIESHFFRTLVVTLAAGLISLSFTDIWEVEKNVERIKVDRSFRNLSMCASTDRFKIDIEEVYTSKDKLAPKLDTKWQTKLDITSSSEEAKVYFNQGLFYLYGFNHAEADRSFKESIRLDTTCAMCHWGVALGLGPNINMPMSPDNNEDAYRYAQKAQILSGNCSPKEKALISALTTRYAEEAPKDRSGLDSLYAIEMRLVSQRYRDDMDIASLFVESLMDCMPWQYWLEDGEPKDRTREALAVLDYIAENDPDHPGANHFYIHLVEEVHPSIGTQSADRLKAMDFPSGHLVHMPSHIYIRTGRYHEASEANVKAMQIDEDYIERCNVQGIYPAAYYPHNIHFLWFAATMEGRSQVSLDAARKLVEKTPEKMFATIPSIERYLTMPYFSLIRFGKWDEVLKEPKPKVDYLYATLMWHYAQGLAYAKKGDIKKAKEHLEIVEKGCEHETIIDLDNDHYPVLSMSRMAALVLRAEVLGLDGRSASKVKQLEEAVAIQDALIYDEPPQFYYPIRQSLGVAHLENSDPKAAERAYREDLDKFPQNGWSLYGLYQALSAQNKVQEANEVKKQYEKAWSLADVELHSAVL